MKFEFLGDGQQFVAAGRHPDTGVDYRGWPRGQDLTAVRRDALPHIDEAGARALVEDLVALLVCEHGFSRPAPPRPSILRPSVGVMARNSATGATGPGATMSRLMGLLRAAAQATPNLDRNQKLLWAACRVREMSAAGELDGEATAGAGEALHQAALYARLASTEISRTIASVMRTR